MSGLIIVDPGASASDPAAFQYVTLVRGEDFRRQPGIMIRDVLNDQANTCTLTLDGQGAVPLIGERIEVLDREDGDRLLFAGNVQSYTQNYEEQTDQLTWDVVIVDSTWRLNKYWPVGTWVNESVSLIVREMGTRFAPGITFNHVQENLTKVTVTFDGTKNFTTCLSLLAEAIGGGHWKVDYEDDLHFFHVTPAGFTLPPTGMEALATQLTLVQGTLIPSTSDRFDVGYYMLRYTDLYDDGTESGFSAVSDLVFMDGSHYLAVSNLPIGLNNGDKVCVARRVYVNRLITRLTPVGSPPDQFVLIEKFCQVNDNTTTAFNMGATPVSAGSSVIIDIPSTATIPSASNVGHPVAPATVPEISLYVGQDDNAWNGVSLAVRVAFLYRDGSVSFPSDASNIVKQSLIKGYYIQGIDVKNIPIGPSINGVDCIARVIYYGLGETTHGDGFSRSWATIPPVGAIQDTMADPDWIKHVGGCGIVNDNTTDHVLPFSLAFVGWLGYNPDSFGTLVSAPGSTILIYPGGVTGGGNKPYGNPNLSTDPIPVWPNPDGPSLEDTDVPADVTDDNPDLMKDPPFQLSADGSQLRNRVKVIGAGSIAADDVAVGATRIKITDPTQYSPAGGSVIYIDQVLRYTGVEGITGAAYITLGTPALVAIPQGTALFNFYQADDLESQKYFGSVELDKNGDPTDGVHEFVIVDNTLKAFFQLYMRAQAELELFAWPIRKVMYCTRDSDSKSGKTVHIDMTDPPCVGDFLIQEVGIDQIHDESDQLLPRYKVTASSVRFDLNDLLLKLLSQKNIGGSLGLGGIIPTAGANASSAVQSGDTQLKSFSTWANNGTTVVDTGWSTTKNGANTVSDGNLSTDSTYVVLGDAGGANATANWVTAVTVTRISFAPITYETKIRTGPSNQSNYIVWAGLHAAATIPLTESLGYGVAFRYHHPAGTSADSGFWYIVVSDGTTQHETPTLSCKGGAAAGSNIYRMGFTIPAGATVVANWFIENLTTGERMTGSESLSLLNVAPDTRMAAEVGLVDIDAAVKNIKVAYMKVTTR